MKIPFKNDEFCIEKDEFCIENDGFCIEKDEFCIENDGFWSSGRPLVPPLVPAPPFHLPQKAISLPLLVGLFSDTIYSPFVGKKQKIEAVLLRQRTATFAMHQRSS